MSHRLTIRTEMTDREVAEMALDQAGVKYKITKNVIHMETAPYFGTTLNLNTGVLQSGDVDYNRINNDNLGILRQYYAEVKFRKECAREGVQVLDRQVQVIEGKKVVVMTWQS